MVVLAAAVFVIVTALVVVALLRRRRAPAGDDSPGDSRRDRRFILVGGLFVPTAILAVVAVYTVRTMNDILPASGVVHIHVAGERWWWRVDYPDLGVTTANEVHVPVGERVDITLTSDNVIHSFWVPQLNGKADLIPGQTNHLSFTAAQAGTYRGQCAEFCGLQHAHMAFLVIADPPAAFDQWAAGQRQAPPAPSDPLAQQGEQILATSVVRRLPHRVRHGGDRHARPRPDPRRQPHDPRQRHAGERRRRHDPLAGAHTARQTGSADAAARPVRPRRAGVDRLPREPVR